MEKDTADVYHAKTKYKYTLFYYIKKKQNVFSINRTDSVTKKEHKLIWQRRQKLQIKLVLLLLSLLLKNCNLLIELYH